MANFKFINSTGVVQADTSQAQADVQAEYRGVFGEDFIVDPATPEGRLIAAEITSRQSVSRNNALLANQFNPNQAEGNFLDAIYALFGGERDQQTRSVAQCTCGGVAGTVIPAGTRARSTAGDIWRTATAATIAASGSVSVSFQADEFGPILASAGSITQIVDNSVLGWETVTNPVAAVAGQNTQSDAQTRLQRISQLAIQGRTTPESVQSRLADVQGYGSHQFRENTSSQTQTIDGIQLAPHSIWVCVSGGSNADVASSLARSKSDGAAFNGAVAVPFVDASSGQTSTVRFDRPTAVSLGIRVTIRATSGADVSQEVVQAVLRYASGQVSGERGFVVGVDATPFEIAAAVNSEVSGVFVRTVELTTTPNSPNWSTDPVSISINQIPTIQESAITVVLL